MLKQVVYKIKRNKKVVIKLSKIIIKNYYQKLLTEIINIVIIKIDIG